MNSEQEHRAKIQRYYTIAQPFYEHFWHGRSLGLHYGFWTDGTRNRNEAIIKENEVLSSLAGIKQNDLVLDAGCGIGGSGIWLAKERGARVVGLNIVDKQLIIGKDLVKKRNLAQEVGFVKGDYQLLPFGNEILFDVFWSLESIEHATDIDNFIREAFRVIKSGGKIVIAATFLGKKEISQEEARQMAVGQSVAGCFNDFRTAEAVSEIMNDVGFRGIQNFDKTAWVMKSSKQMTRMCRVGLPVAKVLSSVHAVPPILVLNNQWGTYQEGLFRSGATSYNILLASKP